MEGSDIKGKAPLSCATFLQFDYNLTNPYLIFLLTFRTFCYSLFSSFNDEKQGLIIAVNKAPLMSMIIFNPVVTGRNYINPLSTNVPII